MQCHVLAATYWIYRALYHPCNDVLAALCRTVTIWSRVSTMQYHVLAALCHILRPVSAVPCCCAVAPTDYWKICVHRDSVLKTAFVTPQGLFEFRVRPFGLTNAPAVFQRLMQKVLAGLIPTISCAMPCISCVVTCTGYTVPYPAIYWLCNAMY